jgi:hypothetical protein
MQIPGIPWLLFLPGLADNSLFLLFFQWKYPIINSSSLIEKDLRVLIDEWASSQVPSKI